MQLRTAETSIVTGDDQEIRDTHRALGVRISLDEKFEAFSSSLIRQMVCLPFGSLSVRIGFCKPGEIFCLDIVVSGDVGALGDENDVDVDGVNLSDVEFILPERGENLGNPLGDE